jgi:hypothetical protein
MTSNIDVVNYRNNICNFISYNNQIYYNIPYNYNINMDEIYRKKMIISKTIAYLEVLKNEYYHSNLNLDDINFIELKLKDFYANNLINQKHRKEFVNEIQVLFNYIFEISIIIKIKNIFDKKKLNTLYEYHSENINFIKIAYESENSINIYSILSMVTYDYLMSNNILNNKYKSLINIMYIATTGLLTIYENK